MSDCKKLSESFYNTDTEDFSKYIRESVVESIREKEWSQEDGLDPEPMRSGPAPRKNVREVQVGDIAEYKTGQGIVGAVTSDGVEIMAGPKKKF